MAGITVARLGVDREKNRVASLKIWPKRRKFVPVCTRSQLVNTHLQRGTQLFSNPPLIFAQLVLTKACSLVACNVINGLLILQCKLQHVEGRVPACRHITRHLSFIEVELLEGLEPQWQDNRC